MSTPVFEGSEKRLEVDFLMSDTSPKEGLRCLSRQQLDILLDKVCAWTQGIMCTAANGGMFRIHKDLQSTTIPLLCFTL